MCIEPKQELEVVAAGIILFHFLYAFIYPKESL